MAGGALRKVSTITISVAGQAFLHLYQGAPYALDDFIWGAVAIYAYYRYRSLLGLIAGHALWNTISLTGSADLLGPQVIAVTAALSLNSPID